MMSAKIQDAMNAHIRDELFSANLYLAMSAHCESKAFKGFGRWLRVQYHEELAHAEKFVDHLLARGGQVSVEAVKAPGKEFGSVLQVFEAVLRHEREVTASLHRFHALAQSEGDTATQVFLQWFVSEQVEEEASVQEIVDKLKLVGDKSSAALYLDKEYGKRGKAA
jgi:ferritin